MSRAREVAGLVAVVAALVTGCKPPESEAPVAEASPSAPEAAPEAGPGGAPGEAPSVAPPAAADKPQVKIPQDRDQAEEKRKMAESRQISAVAVEKLVAGQLDAAINESRRALRVHEQNVEAMLTIAEAFYKQRKYEIVQSVATSILEVDPRVLTPEEKSRAYNLRGFAYLAENKQGSAMTAFRQAAETDEKNATAWNNLGVMYMLQEDWKTAESCFQYAAQLDADFIKARLNWGAAQRGLGQLEAAEATLRGVQRDRPNLADVHFNLGVLYLDAAQFPGLDDKARLEKSIAEFQAYKTKAGAPGVSSPGAAKPTGGASVASALPGKELVSPEQADLYIEAANKGLARIARAEERDRKRKEKQAEEQSEAEAEAEEGAGQPAPAQPGGRPDEPPEGSAPSTEPGPQQPQKPGGGTKSPPSADPPKGESPKPQEPKPQEPKPQEPKPQEPKPQEPKPQEPGGDAPPPQTPKPQTPKGGG